VIANPEALNNSVIPGIFLRMVIHGTIALGLMALQIYNEIFRRLPISYSLEKYLEATLVLEV
jgi:hypothetical protein